MKSKKLIPVTVISGFLGAGKTSVVSHILRSERGKKVGVVINDLAQVNVDARLLRQLDLPGSSTQFEDLQEGCVCCPGGADVSGAIDRLADRNPGIEHIIVECSGMANPKVLAEMLSFGPLSRVTVSAMVTVVDAATIHSWLKSANQNTPHELPTHLSQISGLLVDQIENADVIVLNKADRVPAVELTSCRAAIKALNHSATLQVARFGVVPPEILLPQSGKSSLLQNESSSCSAHCNHDHHSNDDVSTDSSTVAVTSFVFQEIRPFHPARLATLVRKTRQGAKRGSVAELASLDWPMKGVLRSKGAIWVASSHQKSREWVYAGGVLEIQHGDLWLDTDGENNLKVFGNRRQEIVFIGSHQMDQSGIHRMLHECLLTDEEMEGGVEGWKSIPDGLALTLSVAERAKVFSRPTSHSKACPCCDPDLAAFDRLAFGGL